MRKRFEDQIDLKWPCYAQKYPLKSHANFMVRAMV